MPEDAKLRTVLSDAIARLSKRDYTVKLGSLLEDEERRYYITENFKILRQKIFEIINKDRR